MLIVAKDKQRALRAIRTYHGAETDAENVLKEIAQVKKSNQDPGCGFLVETNAFDYLNSPAKKNIHYFGHRLGLCIDIP